jgi:predicted ester cyclase
MHETASMIFADGYATVEGFLVSRHIGEFAGILATGKKVRVPMCHIFKVADGSIQPACIYF